MNKIEYYSYVKAKGSVSINEIRKQLPIDIIKELVHTRDGNENNIIVDKSKDCIVQYLDNRLKIVKSKKYAKYFHTEIKKNYIDEYRQFKIFPRELDWQEHLLFSHSPSQCNTDYQCEFNANITSQIELKKCSKYKNLDIGSVTSWNSNIILIISDKLKTIFDKEEVTGLIYTPCKSFDENIFYQADISNSIYEDAEDIYIKSWCKKCSVLYNYVLFGKHLYSHSILPFDFQAIKGINVKRRQYIYSRPYWFISKKVLNILLKNKIKIPIFTYYLGQRFEPIIINNK